MKNVLVILGHPAARSYCGALAQAYTEGAKKAQAKVKQLFLGDLKFNPSLGNGDEPEPDIQHAREAIKWAEHIVFVYPIWWGTMPALQKAFIERTFVPGFSHAFRKGSLRWDKLLKGRSARLIVTMNTPPFYYRWIFKQPGHNTMKRAVLQFCGVKPVRIKTFGPMSLVSDKRRQRWLDKARELGNRLA